MMSKGERIGMTALIAVIFGVWLTASFLKFGLFSVETIWIGVMAILVLVMVWIPDENKFDAKMTKFFNELSRRRKVQRDMRDEDDPRRITRRKNRRAFFKRHTIAFLFIIFLLEGAGWIWSMVENYNTWEQTMAFLGTFIIFVIMCDQKYGGSTSKADQR